jgi:hypothetical protein
MRLYGLDYSGSLKGPVERYSEQWEWAFGLQNVSKYLSLRDWRLLEECSVGCLLSYV